jgi:hypothetical protein
VWIDMVDRVYLDKLAWGDRSWSMWIISSNPWLSSVVEAVMAAKNAANTRQTDSHS